MNQEHLNRIRRAAGLPPVYSAAERKQLKESAEAQKTNQINEAANNRAPSKVLESIAKQHLHIRSLKRTGDDDKDYHDCPCWAIESALKAAYKAGQESAPKAVKEAADLSAKENEAGGSRPVYDPKGGVTEPKEGEDVVQKEETDEQRKRKGLAKGSNANNYNTPKNKSAKKVTEAKKADKDCDGDGKVETEEEEHKDVVDKDIKKNLKKKKGKEEDCEDVVVEKKGSENYNPPKGTKLTADPKSGANTKKGDVYKDVPHKSNSEDAKSEDKGAKNLKTIGEADKPETVYGKNYGYGYDENSIDRNESPDQIASQDPNVEIKVSVPPRYKAAMRKSIADLRKESERVRVRDPYGAEFYENTANVFEQLLTHLEEGTQRSMMLCQIDLNRVMSPMITRIPNEVYMFIVRGGKPAALTEIFKEVKTKKEKGVDLSKEKYTK